VRTRWVREKRVWVWQRGKTRIEVRPARSPYHSTTWTVHVHGERVCWGTVYGQHVDWAMRVSRYEASKHMPRCTTCDREASHGTLDHSRYSCERHTTDARFVWFRMVST
jgi:hypothetical protein